MDTGALLGVASVAALGLSPVWPALGLALGIAAARTVRGFV